MNISRRDFLKYCGLSAAAVGLSATDLTLLEKALASPTGPSVIWLQGSGCTGCSESFLNRISTEGPATAADVLVNAINLVYHPNLMSLAGQDAVAQAQAAYEKGGYLLAVEGGIPTAFGGRACYAWTYNETEVTFEQAVKGLAEKAAGILCVGTCAAWGGIPAAPPNPTGVKGVKEVTGRNTINIPGCPTHPDWIVWAVVQLLTNQPIALDGYGRPTHFFSTSVHDLCPRQGNVVAQNYGRDHQCLMDLGCRGPLTMANCPMQKWNNRVNWCVDANAPCIGCTEPGFPGTNPFYTPRGQ
ncbi:MAG: hydrogenase small subunit [Desulfobacterota bacterium]|nr:hydrogenase small subunit [Thermodesulfobacteriota bacterium]